MTMLTTLNLTVQGTAANISQDALDAIEQVLRVHANAALEEIESDFPVHVNWAIGQQVKA